MGETAIGTLCGFVAGMCFGIMLCLDVPFIRRMCRPKDFRLTKAKRDQT